MTAATTKLTDFHLVPFPSASASWTAFSDASLVGPEWRFDDRRRLVELLESGRIFELGEGIYDEVPNQLSVSRAVQFIQRLPNGHVLPKVASDGEGDVLLVWEGSRTLLITVEGNHLHAVLNAGEPDSIHYNDIDYLGGKIPSALVEVLPAI